MNRELLSKAIGNIDDRHISEAARFAPEGKLSSPERIIVMSETKTYRTRASSRRIAALAIAACLILSLGIVAYAAGWFGLKEATISDSSLTDVFSEERYEGKALEPAVVITASGLEGTPEYQASKEWREFYNAYVANNYNGDALHQELNDWGKAHRNVYIELYTPALVEKFRSICEEYNLTARSGIYEGSDDGLYSDLCRITGISPFLSDSGRSPEIPGGYLVYDDGSFSCHDWWWPHDDFDNVELAVWDISIARNMKGSMSTGFFQFSPDEQPEEWAYTTAGGDPVSLALGQNTALILYDGTDAFVAIAWQQMNLMRDTGVDLSRESLERYADTVDFAALGSRGAVDFPGSGYGYVPPTPEP